MESKPFKNRNLDYRAVEGLKIQYYLVGIICPPMVEIGLVDLPKSDDTPEIMRFHKILHQLQNKFTNRKKYL
jgi:hypothetical protein